MQLDPSLISGISQKPAPMTTFNEASQNFMQLRQMAQQGEMAKLQLEQAKTAQGERMKLSDIARQATRIGPDGKPVFDSTVVPGLMGQAGMAGAIEADQHQREFQFKLENMKLDRAGKVKNMQAENRKRMAGILGSIVDEPSRQRAIAEIESDPELAGAYPLELITQAYDPATSPDLYEKMTGLYLDPAEQRARATEKRNVFESDRTAFLTEQGQGFTNARAQEANSINDRNRIVKLGGDLKNEFVSRNQQFDKITTAAANMAAVATYFDEKGRPTKSAKARGIVDNELKYINAKVLDPLGAVLTSDYLNQVGGRGWADSFRATLAQAQGRGTILPHERVQIMNGVKRIYEFQQRQVEQQARGYMNQMIAGGVEPSLAHQLVQEAFPPAPGFAPILGGGAANGPGTEPSYAPTGAPGAPSTQPGAPSAPGTAMSPAPGTATMYPPGETPASMASKMRPENAPANAKQGNDGKWYTPDPNRPGKYILWE